MNKQLRRKIILLAVILGLGYLVYAGKANPSKWLEITGQKIEKGTTKGPFAKELNEAVNRKYGQEQKSDTTTP